MKAHWYFITYYYCPMCHDVKEHRQRMYTARPDAWEDRHQEIEQYDWCCD